MYEIIVQILWLVVAIWLVVKGYQANKKAEPFTLRSIFDEKKMEQGFDAMFHARALVIGVVMIIALMLKFFSCGLVCGIV